MRDRLLAIDPWFLLVLPVFIGIYTTARAVVSRFLGVPVGHPSRSDPMPMGLGWKGLLRGPLRLLRSHLPLKGEDCENNAVPTIQGHGPAPPSEGGGL